MINRKKLGILSISTVLSIGVFTPIVSATSIVNEHQDRVLIQVANTESTITKMDLINKLKALFPGRFDFLRESDFNMYSGRYFPENDTIHYNLDFHKEINGKQIYGSVGFVGDELKVENFYYQPMTTSDALFPPQVTKNEAEKIAATFLKQISSDANYQLDNVTNFDAGNQTLIEPIRYTFSFVRTENDVPINDQSFQITILGNGEIVEFYRPFLNDGENTYDDASKIVAENEVATKFKENLSIDLQYSINHDYQTGEPYVQLAYQPTNSGLGIHAISGEWKTPDGFSPELSEPKEVELLTTQPLEPRSTDFTLEKAKEFANELLAIESKRVKLAIESIDERTNYLGKEVISIHYMYEYENGGQGTILELDKQTGEILQYNDIKRDVLKQIGEGPESEKEISRDQALENAIKYLKEFVPSYLHNYSKPLAEAAYDEWSEGFYFTFPRVVDGIRVNGDELSVQISKEGDLLSLYVNQQPIESWPSTEAIITKEEAMALFIEKLSLDLRYLKANNGKKDNHYNLVYLPLFNNNLSSSLDANTGEWNKPNRPESNQQELSHPWAEDELNYLIHAGIFGLEDDQAFDADALITKGDAIEVLMKSLTPFYEIYYQEQEATTDQTYDNIDRDHPLYYVIERAVEMGILTEEKETFDADAPITREEMAVWYIRALDLEQVAKHSGIYQLDFADADKVQDVYTGHVALVNSLGILTASNGRFAPEREMTYAEVAVSIFRLAKEIYDRNSQRYYF